MELKEIAREKKCSVCGEAKPLTAEYYHRQHDKSTGFNACCKVCKNKARAKVLHYSGYTKRYMKDVYNPKRKSLMKDLKSHGCSVCGYNKCTQALHFHHTKEKEFTMCSNKKGLVNIKREASKCVVLCANCHAELHERERMDTQARPSAHIQVDALAHPYVPVSIN